MLKVRDISNELIWEQFLLRSTTPYTPFFQSWDWGEVQKRIGHNVIRIGIFDENTLVGIAQVVEIKAKRAHYLHLRHGPVLTDFEKSLDVLLDDLKKRAKQKKIEFLRMSPVIQEEQVDMPFLTKRGFRKAPIHNMDAENSWVLDLEQDEQMILAGMRKTTRYLVRRAQSLGVEASMTTSGKDFEEFMDLYERTSKRHKFVPHRGVKEEFDVFSSHNHIKLFVARYQKIMIAGALVVFYGNQAVYHHGASADEFKDIPGAYLLQWEAIKEAKRQGKKVYNFWGVVPPEKPKHPWQGLTLFKMGFGGRRVNLIHAQDLPYSPLYWKSYLIETAWRVKRGY